MEPESYADSLGELADALKRWADDPCNKDANCSFGFPFFVDDPLLQVMVKLGADRRDFLAELISANMNRALKKARTFVAAVMREPLPDGQKAWEGVALDTIISKHLITAVGVSAPAIELRSALDDCDWLFYRIDQEIRLTDSPGRTRPEAIQIVATIPIESMSVCRRQRSCSRRSELLNPMLA